jgi:hypothetical protein
MIGMRSGSKQSSTETFRHPARAVSGMNHICASLHTTALTLQADETQHALMLMRADAFVGQF